MKRRRKGTGAVVVRLGGHTYRLELVKRPKVSEVEGRERAPAKGKRGKGPKGHRRGCKCFACRR